MKTWKLALSALGAAFLLVGCGGGGGEASVNGKGFTSMVSFGDNLSDVGAYKVGTIAAVGGGMYTVNSAAARNWTAIIAAQFKLPAPCAAQTGLEGDAAFGLSVPIINHAGCLNYAQGGARVTSQPGPGNKLLGGSNATLGQITLPVKDQMTNHLVAMGGAYSGKELVTVMAGANDVFIQIGSIAPTVASLVGSGQSPADAQATAITAAVTAMGIAGAELAAYIDGLVLQKGAKTVVVANIPNLGKTPAALAQDTATQGLVTIMVNTFNAQLKAGLQNKSGVVLVDAFTESNSQAATPSAYGLTNVADAACSRTSASNPLGGSSLACTAASVVPVDTSHYLYADEVHPTPYGYELLAKFVLLHMNAAGLL